MSEPTDADRAKAAELVRKAVWMGHPDDLADAIAAALAEGRERARAPFLAVADEIHQRGVAEVEAMDAEPDEYRRNQCASRAATYARAEHLIRHAAEPTP